MKILEVLKISKGLNRVSDMIRVIQGVVLVEVLWKVISGIINCLISSSVQFHDALHGFCAGRGTRTATLEAKLLQQIISMRETVLHAIFLDLINS